MIPSNRLLALFNKANTVSYICGVEIRPDKPRINIFLLNTCMMIVFFFSLSTITIVKELQEDWKRALETCVFFGSGIQGTAKFVTGIRKVKALNALNTHLESIFRIYEHKNESYTKHLHKSVDRMEFIVRFISISYVIAFGTMSTLPVFIIIFRGEYTLVMQYRIPGLSIDTAFGYTATLIMQMVMLALSGFGLFVGDLYVLIYLSQSYLFADIFEQKIAELNAKLERISSSNSQLGDTRSSMNENSKITEDVRDIVKWHQDYIGFNEAMNLCCYDIIAAQIITAAIGVILTIFILFTSTWPVAYLYITIMYYNVIVYCIMGTKVEYCDDRLTYAIYNISWYYLTVPQRKIVNMMLIKSQYSSAISVFGVLPLSVATALKITRVIYSLTMMMAHFFLD